MLIISLIKNIYPYFFYCSEWNKTYIFYQGFCGNWILIMCSWDYGQVIWVDYWIIFVWWDVKKIRKMQVLGNILEGKFVVEWLLKSSPNRLFLILLCFVYKKHEEKQIVWYPKRDWGWKSLIFWSTFHALIKENLIIGLGVLKLLSLP